MKFHQFWPGFNPSNHWFFRQIREKDGVCFSVFGSDYNTPSESPKIFYSAESHPWNKRGFEDADLTVTFHDMPASTHLRLPNYVCIHGPEFVKEKIRNRIDMPVGANAACMVASNGSPDERKRLVKTLQKQIRVDCGGPVLNNVERIPNSSVPAERDQYFVDFAKQYKFVVAGENEQVRDYTTEKLFNAFRAGAVPIYWGNPDTNSLFKRQSFIHCGDYDSFEDVADRVEELAEDEEAYAEKRTQAALPNANTYDENKINNFIHAI